MKKEMDLNKKMTLSCQILWNLDRDREDRESSQLPKTGVPMVGGGWKSSTKTHQQRQDIQVKLESQIKNRKTIKQWISFCINIFLYKYCLGHIFTKNIMLLTWYSWTGVLNCTKLCQNSKRNPADPSVSFVCFGRCFQFSKLPSIYVSKEISVKNLGLCGGAWAAQLVQCPTLGFGSGHHLTVCEFEPESASVPTIRGLLGILSPSLSTPTQSPPPLK